MTLTDYTEQLEDALRRTKEANAMLWRALDESVKLQSHYATLLNLHDGGERRPFASADEWIARLKETGTLA